MRVNQPTSSSQIKPADQQLELREGEVYSVKIKEQVSDKEAIVQIRGKDVRVQFDGQVPQGDRVAIQITDSQGVVPRVKTVANQSTTTNGEPDLSTVIRNFGETATPELRLSAKILMDAGIPLNKEAIRDLKDFLEKSTGSIKQKLETVQAIANKKLDVTANQLRAVHETLHGKPLTGTLFDLAKSNNEPAAPKHPLPQSSIVSGVKAIFDREPNLEKAIQQVRELILNSPKLGTEVSSRLEKALLEAVKLQLAGREGAARLFVQQTLEQIKTIADTRLNQSQPTMDTGMLLVESQTVHVESSQALQKLVSDLKLMMAEQDTSLEQLLQKFQEQVQSQQQLNREVVLKVEKALAQAVSLEKIGWGQVGRDQVKKVLDQLGDERLASTSGNDYATQGVNVYDDNASFQVGALLATKDLVVTEITQKLSQAATQFQSIKREVSRNIDNIIQVTQTNKGNILSGVKPLLESAIDMMDKAILKSEITMLTDMETEKQLMKASGDLAEARRLLTKGENDQAITVLRDVKARLESLQWKPSNVRIQHFMTTDHIFSDEAPRADRLFHQVVEATQHFQSQPPSARNTFEFFRSMGLNHDSEVAQFLSMAQGQGQGQQEGHDLHKNLKAALLHLGKMEEAQSTPAQSSQTVEQALQNVTGQQLLSKSETGTQLQSMFFQLPILLENGLENLKLYVNSKAEGQKVDWENCSLYFLIETKKLGQTGIHISAVDRNLSITIRNDHPGIKKRVESLVAKCKENLTEIGYNIAGVVFTKLTEEKKPRQPQSAVSPAPVKSQQPGTFAKGFDFKI
jgi:predicted RNA-binding protein with TRAM domain